MNDKDRRAYEAGKSGMLLSQFLNGIPEKDRREAVLFFEMGVIDQKKKDKEQKRG